MSTHYFFPPASAYPLNQCLYRLKSDAEYRVRFVKDPEAAMDEHALDAAARAALRGFARDPLIALGAHPKAIQERLGHSSITVTLDRYGHLFPKLDEELTDRLDGLQRAAAGAGTG